MGLILMETTSPNFNKDLQFSKEQQIKLKSFYRKHSFEGRYVFGEKAEYQRMLGIDTLIQKDDYTCIWVEEKFIRKPNDSFFIETESCTTQGHESDGWIRKSRADYLLYCFSCMKPMEAYLVSMGKLREWFLKTDYKDSFVEFTNKTYNATRGYWVPIKTIQENLEVKKYLI